MPDARSVNPLPSGALAAKCDPRHTANRERIGSIPVALVNPRHSSNAIAAGEEHVCPKGHPKI
jgi:hypothetical protein